MSSWTIDSGFPGGNILVDRISGQDIYLRQDLRDSHWWWFYWSFRLRGGVGQRFNFHFTHGSPISHLGPAVSDDDGRTWRWLGSEWHKQARFEYEIRSPGRTRFAHAWPYVDADLRAFVRRWTGRGPLQAGTLCISPNGWSVPLLRLGPPHADQAVLLTCRHHCCESMASYLLEGLMEAALDGAEDGGWLARNVQLLVLPFMDADGVADGDQGKSRNERDHNRDYAGTSLYAETAALRRMAGDWPAGWIRLAMDMHCPFYDERRIYLTEQPQCKDRAVRLSGLLEQTLSGPLPYSPAHNLQGREVMPDGTTFVQWAAVLPGGPLATLLELPYALAGDVPVTGPSARRLGRDLARAMWLYLDPSAAQG